VAAAAQGARVVKIFNTTGAANMADPRYGNAGVTMLYAGDDPAAKSVAASLAGDLGFDPVDLGALAQSRLLEPFALVWITLAIHQAMGTDFALNIVQRPRR
jgi:predicted dinucleotide-binding enzyme